MWGLLLFIGCLAFVGLAIYSVFAAFAPSTPEAQLREYSFNLLDFVIDDGYEILNSSSMNNHPDRPQDLKVKLSDDMFNKFKIYIDTLAEGDEITVKNGTEYIKTITKNDDGCDFVHRSSHVYADSKYMFFKATAHVDYAEKTITFFSCFY